MKKLLFIDHAFHQKTRSADFFVDMLRQAFDVEIHYLVPEGALDPTVLAAADAADVILLWQLDFLAPVFVAMGKPTVVAPMFDGSGGMPDMHWLFGSGARYLNFSRRLHERVRLLGLNTKLIRYFPAPVEEHDLPPFDQFNAFFWQRRPDHGLHHGYVEALIGDDLDRLHVHNVADIPGSFQPRQSKTNYKFTTSNWFRDRADYEEQLGAANIFIAPRASEGIGIALLEAMARGMLVLAHDAPTNNEYVSNWVNGVLFNKDAVPTPIHIRQDAARLARMAWRTVVEGHREWNRSHDAIRKWIDETPARRPIGIDIEPFFSDLWHSYYGSHKEYEFCLRRHIGLLEDLTPFEFTRVLDLLGDRQNTSSSKAKVRQCELPASGILDLTLDEQFVGTGWSAPEPEWRWAIGTFSEMYFRGLDHLSKRVKVRFTASSLPELGKRVHCTMALNGKVVFDGGITPRWKDYEFSFDAELLQDENRLTLVFDKASSIPTDKRSLSVCFKSFQFVPAASASTTESEPLSSKGLTRIFRPGSVKALLGSD